MKSMSQECLSSKMMTMKTIILTAMRAASKIRGRCQVCSTTDQSRISLALKAARRN